MNSRARFSLGLPTRLPPPSSHSSIAGSTAMAWARVRKSPVPSVRWRAFWIAIRLANFTFWMLVAKWPCQNHVMRSGNGRSAAAMRSSHQTTSWVRCWASACADAGSFGIRATAAKAGAGVAAAPASGPGVVRASSVASNPAAAAVSSSPRRGPNPSRWSRRRTASRSPIGVMSPSWPVNVRAMSGIGPGLVRGGPERAYRGRMARAYGLLLVVALAVLAGCESQAPARSGPPSSNYTTSLAAVQDKVDAIAQDSCTTRPAVQAYPDCARYVAEVGNVALATQSAATTVADGAALQATAGRLADEVGQFSRTGCVAAPGVAGPPAQVCGDALKKIQSDLKAMRTQLSATSPPR